MAVLAKLMEEIAGEIVENDVTFGRSSLNKLLGALSVDDDGLGLIYVRTLFPSAMKAARRHPIMQ